MSEQILDLPPPAADVRISYGPEPLQFGDIRLPHGSVRHPLAIVVHGGFWRAQYDLAHIGHLCQALTTAGIATWNIEYRRICDDGGGWPGTFHDVAAAADHVRQLAKTYSVDLERVITVGHSAGGHLALWLAARRRIPSGDPLYTPNPIPIRAAVSLAGVSDLSLAWQLRLRDGIVREFMGASPEGAPGRYRTASPAALLPLGLPQILIHGTDDDSVPYSMSERYVVRAAALGDEVSLVTLDRADHFALIDPRTLEWAAVQQAIIGSVC